MSLFQRNLSRLKLITFDVTDTLIKIKHGPGYHYRRAALEYGLDLSEQNINSNFKTNYKKLVREYPNFGLKSIDLESWDSWWKLLVTKTLQDSGGNKLSTAQLHEISQKLIADFETENCWDKISSSDQLILELRNHAQVGVITNSDPRTEKILKNLNYPQFQFVISAYEFGIEKPDRKIFDEALKLTKTKPDEALHIGNDLNKDYLGAKDAGWNAILIGNVPDQSINQFSSIDLLYKSLHQKIIPFE